VARVDYESAWTDLLDLVASRDGWGANRLIAEAARIAGRHRVEEGLLERSLRIYGGQITLAVSNSGALASALIGSTPIEGAPVPARSKPEEGANDDGPDDGSHP
jgi:hypothetical protein